jgi:hypothetical protein
VPIDVTVAGIKIELILELLKAKSPIDVSSLVLSSFTTASRQAFSNAEFPMEVTLGGIAIEVSLELLKAELPIVVS